MYRKTNFTSSAAHKENLHNCELQLDNTGCLDVSRLLRALRLTIPVAPMQLNVIVIKCMSKMVLLA